MKKYLALGFSAILFAGGANAQYGRGLRVDPEGWKHCKFMAPMTRDVYTNLPRAASVQKWTPVPSTQGNTGTCVAWASTYCAATICWAQKNGVTNRQTITKNAMLPAYTYLHIKQSGDTYCQNGSDGESAARFLQTTGALKYSSNSEKCCLNGNPSNASEASQNKITSYTTLFYDWPIKRNTANVIKVKKAIAEGRPVIFGMMLPNSFMEERNFDSQGLYKPTENLNSVSEDGGHEMCIVAYDDDKFGGAFLVQNSWGTDWAYKGYFWLTYSIFVNTVVDAHSLYVPIASAANNTVDLTTSKLDFSTTGANSGCGYGGNDGGNDGGGNNGYDDYYNNDYNYDDGGYDNNNYGYDDYGYDDYGYDNYDNYYDGNYSYDNNDDYYYDPYGGFDNNNNYNYYDITIITIITPTIIPTITTTITTAITTTAAMVVGTIMTTIITTMITVRMIMIITTIITTIIAIMITIMTCMTTTKIGIRITTITTIITTIIPIMTMVTMITADTAIMAIMIIMAITIAQATAAESHRKAIL
ncbi:MAG: C1 family peptidase [Bacteroidales bacterium]|nr:C1 family peptidase [Bacteroidales bacterium]